MVTHSSILPWRIPEMAEPGGLPSMGCTESDTTEVTQQQQQQQQGQFFGSLGLGVSDPTPKALGLFSGQD